MTTAIALFGAFEDREVRWNGDLDQPEWIAQDVAAVLGIKEYRKVISRYPDNYKGVTISHSLGGDQEFLSLTEPGLYRIIFASRKPEAEKFRAWVFEEVLPQIRKTGSYGTAVQQMQSDLAELKAMVQTLMETRSPLPPSIPNPLFNESEIRRWNQREMYWSTIPGTTSYENCESVRRLLGYQPEEREPDRKGLIPLGEVLNICRSLQHGKDSLNNS